MHPLLQLHDLQFSANNNNIRKQKLYTSMPFYFLFFSYDHKLTVDYLNYGGLDKINHDCENAFPPKKTHIEEVWVEILH